MERAGGFVIKLFMPSPPGPAGGGGWRKKSFSISTSYSSTLSVLPKKSASANHGRSVEDKKNDTRSNGMPGKTYHDSTKRYQNLKASRASCILSLFWIP
jgi:hypothetical protein